MKNGGDCKEKKEENWGDPEDRILIKNSKDPPEENQINCDFIKNSQNNEEEYVRRPMNAFMVWSRSERRKLALKYPNMLNCEISKLLGAEWSKMSENDKKPYVQESKKLRTIHSQKYPEYSYRPRRKKRKSDATNFNTSNGLSCYTLQNSDLYDSAYNQSNYNYGYYYDQYTHPYVSDNVSTCQNSNYTQQYNRNDKVNYFQYQPNSFPNTYSDYKVVAPYSTDQGNYQCNNFFSSVPFVQSTVPTVENVDRTTTYNYGTINTLFPEITTNQAEIIQADSSKQPPISQPQNFLPTVTESCQPNII